MGTFLAKVFALFFMTLSLGSQGYCSPSINGALNFNGTNNYVISLYLRWIMKQGEVIRHYAKMFHFIVTKENKKPYKLLIFMGI